MGVYNPLEKMPRRCLDCERRIGDYDAYCPYLGSIYEYLGNYSKPSNCPLVEVKAPHGRLIDADAIDTSYSDPEVVETLREAPAIIETERE